MRKLDKKINAVLIKTLGIEAPVVWCRFDEAPCRPHSFRITLLPMNYG
jgi:hypothetical protein